MTKNQPNVPDQRATGNAIRDELRKLNAQVAMLASTVDRLQEPKRLHRTIASGVMWGTIGAALLVAVVLGVATVARMPDVEPVSLRLTGTAGTPETADRLTATGAATPAQVRAIHGDTTRTEPPPHTLRPHAGVAELADAADSKSAG